MGDTCRLCWLATTEPHPLYEAIDDGGDQITLADKITHLVELLVCDDGLPRIICAKCKHEVEHFYSFKCGIEKSERMLRQIRGDRSSAQQPTAVTPSKVEVEIKTRIEEETPHEDVCEMHIMDDDLARFVNSTITAEGLIDNDDESSPTPETYVVAQQEQEELVEDIELPAQSVYQYEDRHYMANNDDDVASIAPVNDVAVAVKHEVIEVESECEEYDLANESCPESSQSITTTQLPQFSDHIVQCAICLKVFKNEYNLRRHMPLHSNVFQCDICCHQFRAARDLNQHILRHKGERNQKCRFCDKLFCTTGDARSHERRVHKKLME